MMYVSIFILRRHKANRYKKNMDFEGWKLIPALWTKRSENQGERTCWHHMRSGQSSRGTDLPPELAGESLRLMVTVSTTSDR